MLKLKIQIHAISDISIEDINSWVEEVDELSVDCISFVELNV